MTNIKSFQTGRQYSANGQRIAYKVLNTDTSDPLIWISEVAFVDADRYISGVLNVIHDAEKEPKQTEIMASYDAGGYKDGLYGHGDLETRLAFIARLL